ncbi:DNA alkylation repair protein [Lewinella lacunae]|uniref:DNA alkylation repair protein n=1 Tax=Neolewinella lacunae TaxID=1517758 RepID=A0A923PG37_9BACT|nr:DNA alkylation repair protein [Neolewinella lacunae]
MVGRKPALKVADVPAEVLHYLNLGTLESANLTEWLAIDPVALVSTVFKKLRPSWIPVLTAGIQDLKKPTAMAVTRCVGAQLAALATKAGSVDATLNWLLAHPSDTVRGYAATMVAALDLPLADTLQGLRPVAADAHFGPREIAMFAAKPCIGRDLDLAVRLLRPFTAESDENLRRFAIEATRPIGVWTSHLPALKAQPGIGLPLLEPLRADPSRYVQNAVANWLNDAAKSQPAWVRQVCQRWLAESPGPATAYIVKRGMRNL